MIDFVLLLRLEVVAGCGDRRSFDVLSSMRRDVVMTENGSFFADDPPDR